MDSPEARPVTRYRTPRYPTRLQILGEPRLLARHVPPAWLSNRELAGVVGAVLAANSAGCSNTTSAAAPESAPNKAAPENAAWVAPGLDGRPPKIEAQNRGFLACVAVAPPVFLSEEDALQVIAEELETHGLELSERDVTLESVMIEQRDIELNTTAQSHFLHKSVCGPLQCRVFVVS